MWEVVKSIKVYPFVCMSIILIAAGSGPFLYYKLNKKNSMLKENLKGKKEEDIDNVIASIFHSKDLYDTLKIKCHPDRFFDIKEIEKATELFQQITENKSNYKILKQIEERAMKELNILTVEHNELH